MTYYVYALVDPIQNVPFYIGKGKGDRMYTHLKYKDRTNSRKRMYIENIRLFGEEPKAMKIVDNIKDERVAYDLEYNMIKISKERYGHPIVNRVGVDLRPPSRKGVKWSKESIEKRSETLQKMRKSGYVRPPMSDSQKKMLSDINKGKEGPNKKYVCVNTLKSLYLDKNMTKREVMLYFDIGLGSLNRILRENKIKKIAKS